MVTKKCLNILEGNCSYYLILFVLPLDVAYHCSIKHLWCHNLWCPGFCVHICFTLWSTFARSLTRRRTTMVWRHPECSLLIVLIAERWQVTVKSLSHFGGVDLILVATRRVESWRQRGSVVFCSLSSVFKILPALMVFSCNQTFCHLSIPVFVLHITWIPYTQ